MTEVFRAIKLGEITHRMSVDRKQQASNSPAALISWSSIGDLLCPGDNMGKAWKEKSLPGFTRHSMSERSVWSRLPSLPLPHLSHTGSKVTAPLPTLTYAQIQRVGR